MMLFTPTVSIVVPVYNGANTIAACLESLLTQDYPREAYEIIVVENGSTDNTSKIVEKYPVRLLPSEQRGSYPARNLGIAHSQADVIAFTDADCIAAPDWLSELVQPYADLDVGGVGGPILAYEHPQRSHVEMFSDKHSPLVNFISGESEYMPHLYAANASYRRCLLDEIGGFNPHLVTAGDVDLAWRCQLQTGCRLGYAPKAVIYHHHRATRIGLARQYRRYGFGEILLDTMYGKNPGYPRGRGYQLWRLLEQTATLPRYALSAIVRQFRLMTGRTTPYQAIMPRLWFLVESNNIRGKLEGLVATRFMTDPQPALDMESVELIDRLFQSRKE